MYVDWCDSKHRYQEGIMCLQQIGLCVITILDSIVIIVGERREAGGRDLYDHLLSMRIFT